MHKYLKRFFGFFTDHRLEVIKTFTPIIIALVAIWQYATPRRTSSGKPITRTRLGW